MMSDDDQESVDAVARALLEACVELQKETVPLAPSERQRDELARFAILEKIRRDSPVPADAIRERLLELAAMRGSEFFDWMTDLFERFRQRAD